MLVFGTKRKSTKIQRLLRPKKGGRGMYNNKMAVKFGLVMRMTTTIQSVKR